jgi:membrane associated rhomboid family serine protease
MSTFKGFGQGGFGQGGFGNSPFNSSESILKGIKDSFRQGSDMTKLIYINIAIFLAMKILAILGFLIGNSGITYQALDLLAVPSDTSTLLTRPWTILTYMFVHKGFLHLLFNMLWLFWFGKMFQESLSRARLSAVYILGGLTGAAIYMLAYNIFPAFQEAKFESIAIGASASVMAIVFAVAFYNPQRKLRLAFIGDVKLIHIALISIIVDVISLPSGNAGGHIAHLGGALYGYLFAINYRKNKDISSFFVSVIDSFSGFISRLFSSKPKMKVHRGDNQARHMDDKQYNSRKKEDQERINSILDKISKSGYDSLTQEEKGILFRSGRR